jgi:hypothetical protein
VAAPVIAAVPPEAHEDADPPESVLPLEPLLPASPVPVPPLPLVPLVPLVPADDVPPPQPKSAALHAPPSASKMVCAASRRDKSEDFDRFMPSPC